MGWDSQHVEKGTPTIDVLRHDLNGEYEIIDHAVTGGAAYLAVRRRDEGEEGTVEAVVVLVKRGGRDYFNFSAKWMDERMGPYYYDCPVRILDKLSPTSDALAMTWRHECRKRAAKVKAAKAVKPGTIIEFPEPIEFNDGVSRSRFVFVERSTFRALDGVRVSITSWRKRDFEIVGALAA